LSVEHPMVLFYGGFNIYVMSKEYFSHDYNARSDPKMRDLFINEGMVGLGIYWCLIEMLYEEGGYLPLKFVKLMSVDFKESCDRIGGIIRNYGLFKCDDDIFYSESVLKRLDLRKEKSEAARKAALERWERERKKQLNDN